MKNRQKRVIVTVVIMAGMLILWKLFLREPLPEGSVPVEDIISWCIGDAMGDGTCVLLAIAGDGIIDTGERHGGLLLVCDATVEADMERYGYIPPDKILYRIDLTAIKPVKVQLGDVNGDGVNEVAICVYKTAKFHPVMDKRPFFFDLVEGNLIPIWLGSRLSRPFDDYILYDIDADDIDEIISIERLENDHRVIAVYNWRGFGFEMLTQSEEFDGDLRFDPDASGQAEETGGVSVVYSNNKEYIMRRFYLKEDKLVFESH